MTTATLARISRPAKPLPVTRDQVAIMIDRLSILRGKIAELDGQCADDIAQIKAFHASAVSVYDTEAEQLIGDVQAYCEAHRLELTKGGKVKVAKFPSGSVSWRKRPASIAIADLEEAVADVVRRGLPQFLRTKYSVDKDAMLKDAALASKVAGVTVLPGAEEFIIKTGA